MPAWLLPRRQLVGQGGHAGSNRVTRQVRVTVRGVLVHTFTRIHFDDEAAADSLDTVLASVPAARRCRTPVWQRGQRLFFSRCRLG